jgi:hypothetical protein
MAERTIQGLFAEVLKKHLHDVGDHYGWYLGADDPINGRIGWGTASDSEDQFIVLTPDEVREVMIDWLQGYPEHKNMWATEEDVDLEKLRMLECMLQMLHPWREALNAVETEAIRLLAMPRKV